MSKARASTFTGAVEESPPTLPSTTDKKFLKTIEDWLRGQSEIMILVRYSREAGNKSFEFFTSFAALRERLARLKAETSVTALREPQLPFRGRVDDEFISKCLGLIPTASEFLVLEIDPRMAKQQWLFNSFDSRLKSDMGILQQLGIRVRFASSKMRSASSEPQPEIGRSSI
jgi:hypothetical protein